MIWLIIHAAATWFMVGLIWFVQIVHYPMFANVGRDSFDVHRTDRRGHTFVAAAERADDSRRRLSHRHLDINLHAQRPAT